MAAFADPQGDSPLGMPLWGNQFDAFYNDNPQAAYQRLLHQQGVGWDTGPRGDYYQQQFGRLWQDYVGQVPQRGLNFNWLDYLGEQGPQLEQRFNSLDPRSRGERYGYGTGRVRYLL